MFEKAFPVLAVWASGLLMGLSVESCIHLMKPEPEHPTDPSKACHAVTYTGSDGDTFWMCERNRTP